MLTNLIENRGKEFSNLIKIGDYLARTLRENVEMFGVEFCGSVAPEQLIFEKDTDFRNQGLIVLFGCRNFYGRNQVFFSISPNSSYR